LLTNKRRASPRSASTLGIRVCLATRVLGWLEGCAPASYSERQLEELDRLIKPWLDDYERTSRAARK
jgi:hypothetical protein